MEKLSSYQHELIDCEHLFLCRGKWRGMFAVNLNRDSSFYTRGFSMSSGLSANINRASQEEGNMLGDYLWVIVIILFIFLNGEVDNKTLKYSEIYKKTKTLILCLLGRHFLIKYKIIIE
ncbi:hypothetical protein Avbf_12884 [Armadillidium vulgare]|nr:hypothetical protein Avbf_12884 [Armadillidium vulgare]